MSNSAGPKIARDSSLIVNIDAANKKSYPTAGTSWVDLTKNNAIGAMTSCTFDAGNQGSVVFNGSSSNVYYPSNTLYSFGTGDFTLESFITINAATTIKPIAQNDPVGTSQNNKWWLAYDSSVAGLRFGRHFTSTYASCAWTPVSGQWYHVAAVTSSNLMYFYINGISQSVTNQTSMSGISYSQNGLTIGAISTPYYLNGKIASFKMYNKSLTSTEVYNNFVANRGRFVYNIIVKISKGGAIAHGYTFNLHSR